MSNWTRHCVFIIVSIIFSTAFAQAPQGDGRLTLYYDARHDTLDVSFRDTHGKVIPTALDQISYFLRSPDNQTHTISLALLDLVDQIQDHFAEPTIEIISGYRSPTYNQNLKATGHAVANESLHTHGQAMDIHLDTVTEEAVRDYASSLQQGGVGYYPQNDFVHVDLGPVRHWGHNETQRKWVGVNNNKGPLQIRSDRNNYANTDTIIATIYPHTKILNYTLEKFDRGIWKKIKTFTHKSNTNHDLRLHTTKTPLPLGRYRLVIDDSFSNEFYIKNDC